MNDWIVIVWMLVWLIFCMLMFIGDRIFEEESPYGLYEYGVFLLWPVWVLIVLFALFYYYFAVEDKFNE